MNIALLLTPKKEVVTLNHHFTIEEAMEVMSVQRFSSVPVIDSHGHFRNALSEGDILWYMEEHSKYTRREMAYTSIRKIKRHHDIKAVSINANLESLIDLVYTQSFVPVVDDDNVFIGIIKRSDIIHYTMTHLKEKAESMVS